MRKKFERTDLLGCLGDPEGDDAVERGQCTLQAIGTVCHRKNVGVDVDLAVVSCGRGLWSQHKEGKREQVSRTTNRLVGALALKDIPELDCVVPGAREQHGTHGAEGQRSNRGLVSC